MSLNLWKSIVLTILLVSSLSVSASDEVAEIQAMIKTEPELALIRAEEHWQGKQVSSQHFNSGMLLINAMSANKEFDKARVLLQKFSDLPALSEVQLAMLLAQEINLIRSSKKGQDLQPLVTKAESMLLKFRAVSDQAEVDNAIYELSRAIGFKYYFEGSFSTAEPYFLESLVAIDRNKHQALSDLLNTIGVVKAQQADLAGGAEYMLKSIEVLEQHGLPIASSSYRNLGSLHFMLKEWDKSIAYSQKSLDLDPKRDEAAASALSNMAAAYVEKGELDKAIELLNMSIDVSEELGSSTASARNNLGYIYNQVGKYQQALEQLTISKAEFIKEDREEELSLIYKSMGDVYANLQNYDQAIKLYEQAYQLHKIHDFKMKRVELYPKMIDVLVKQNRYKRAYELMVEFKTLNDEIINVDSTEKVNEVLATFEVEKNKQALIDSELARSQQQKSIDILNSRNELEERMMRLMIIMVSALVLLLLFIFRSWHFRGKVNKVLLDKNERIENQQNQLVKLNTQLKGQAEVDSLTGINNRRFITNKLTEIIADPNLANKKWCLIIIDIDNFKAINDKYGHQRGDEVLQQFAQCLDWVRGPEDLIARWGGEEFIWLVECKSQNDASKNCDEFQTALADLSWFRGNEDTVSCSMGFSSFPLIDMNFEDWEAALRLADYALYQCKHSGKNCWTGFELIDPKIAYDDIKDIESLVKDNRLRLLKK